MSTKLYIGILTLICTYDLNLATNEEIIINNGIYFKETKNVIPYQLTLPILIKTKLPPFGKTIESIIEKTLGSIGSISETEKLITSNFEHLLMTYDYTLKDFFQTPLQKLRKRDTSVMQIINSVRDTFGDLLVLCCRALTYRDGKNFFENEKTLEESYKNLKNNVIEDHKNLFDTQHYLSKLAQSFEKQTNALNSTFDLLFKEILNENKIATETNTLASSNKINLVMISYYLSINREMNRIFNMLNSCKEHRLSGIIIDHNELRKNIKLLREKVKNLNIEPVLDENDIDDYYHASLLNCHVYTDNEENHILESEIRIPMKTLNANYKIFQTISIPFKSNDNKICTIDSDTKFLIEDSTHHDLIQISKENSDNCNSNSPFCIIPKTRTNLENNNCISNLFKNPTKTTSMFQFCKYKCSDSENLKPVVIQLEEDTFSITMFYTIMTINIDTNEVKILKVNNSLPGTIILKVPCNYEVVHTNILGITDKIISSSVPCIANSDLFSIKISYSIPINFIANNSIKIEKSNFSDNINEENILKIDSFIWDNTLNNIPQVVNSEDFEKRLKNITLMIPNLDSDNTFSFIHLVIITWQALITFIFAFLLYLHFCKGNIFNIFSKKLNIDEFTKRTFSPDYNEQEINYLKELKKEKEELKQMQKNKNFSKIQIPKQLDSELKKSVKILEQFEPKKQFSARSKFSPHLPPKTTPPTPYPSPMSRPSCSNQNSDVIYENINKKTHKNCIFKTYEYETD